MERLRITIDTDPPAYITVESPYPPRARQISRWLFAHINAGTLPRPESSDQADDLSAQALANQRRKAAKIAKAKRKG